MLEVQSKPAIDRDVHEASDWSELGRLVRSKALTAVSAHFALVGDAERASTTERTETVAGAQTIGTNR